MATPERWARTRHEIHQLEQARVRADLCAGCGRHLGEVETVYIERFAVGTRRAEPGSRRPTKSAPVGAECAGPDLVRRAAAEALNPCDGCGRPVIYRTMGRKHRVATACSQLRVERRKSDVGRAKHRARMALLDQAAASTGALVTRDWWTRLSGYREARGLSQPDLAAAMRRPGQRVDVHVISRREHGHITPKIADIGALAVALGVSMEELLYGPEEAERIALERRRK